MLLLEKLLKHLRLLCVMEDCGRHARSKWWVRRHQGLNFQVHVRIVLLVCRMWRRWPLKVRRWWVLQARRCGDVTNIFWGHSAKHVRIIQLLGGVRL